MIDLDIVKENYTIVQQKNIDTLFEFLSYPLNSEKEIISKFCTIPGAIHKIGNCERKFKNYTAYDLPVSQEFRTYIESKLHIEDDYGGGWTDIIALSSSNSDCCCAANFCVGYYHAHSPNEYLVIDEWCKSFEKYKSFLEEEQRRFTI